MMKRPRLNIDFCQCVTDGTGNPIHVIGYISIMNNGTLPTKLDDRKVSDIENDIFHLLSVLSCFLPRRNISRVN